MDDSEVVIVVSSRDKSNPEEVRRRWRATQRNMEADARESGDRSGKGWLKGFGDSAADGGGLGAVMSKITSSYTSVFKLSAKSAATAFSAQFLASVAAGLASGAAKVAHGVASIAALLPAAALTGAMAFGTLRLAVAGVGDALEKAVTGDAKAFDDAIKGLSPAARSFAREVRGMREGLIGLKDAVQDRFFAQFEGQASRLAKAWLPILRREMGALAEGFGDTVNSMAKWARQPAVVLTLTTALRNARGALGNLLAGATNLAQAFLPLVAVGSTFLPRLTRGFGDATAKFALFMQHAADTGKLAGFIQGGLDKLRSLGETFGQLWRIGGNVVAVLREFGSVGGGVFAALGIETGGLLDSLETLTAKAKVFFQTGSGGAAITEIFGILRSLLNATFGALAHLVPIIGRVFAPLLPQLSKFAEAIATLQLALADALAPALEVVADLLADILPPITSVLNFMADNKVVASALAGVIVGLYVAWKIGAITTAIAQSSLNATMGVGIATVAAFIMSMKQIDALNHAREMDVLVEKFSAMDGAVNDSTRAWIKLTQIMGNMDEFMSKLIDSNPRLAQSVIDQAEAYGISAEDARRYQDELNTATAAIENQVDALTRQKNAMRAMTDPVFAAMTAQQRLADAQQHLIDVQKDENATAADLQQAHQDVAEAAYDNEAAMLDLGAAMESGKTSLDAVLDSLKEQRDAGVITQETYNRLALVATAKFGEVETAVKSVPTSRTTKLYAKDYASAAAAKIAAKLNYITSQSYNFSIGANISAAAKWAAKQAGGFSHGGTVGAAAAGGPRSGWNWVGEDEPELLKLPPGTQVRSGPDSRRMAAEAGGAMNVRLIVDTGGAGVDRVLADLIRRFVKVQTGGDVQAALGWSR